MKKGKEKGKKRAKGSGSDGSSAAFAGRLTTEFIKMESRWNRTVRILSVGLDWRVR